MRIRSRLFLAITPRSISLLRKVLNKSVGSIWSHEWRQGQVGVFFGLGYWCVTLACPGKPEVVRFWYNLGIGLDDPCPVSSGVTAAAQYADHVEHARLACRRNPDVAVVADPGAGFDWC